MSKRVPHKRKIIDLYVFQKSLYSMYSFLRYIKICNTTPIQVGRFMHLTSLVFGQCSKCIVFMLMPKCNQACITVHITWYKRQRLVLSIDTATFVWIHPEKGETRWLPGLTDPPSFSQSNLLLRAVNSHALSVSLTPGHYFSHSHAKHAKSPTWMRNIPPST